MTFSKVHVVDEVYPDPILDTGMSSSLTKLSLKRVWSFTGLDSTDWTGLRIKTRTAPLTDLI